MIHSALTLTQSQIQAFFDADSHTFSYVIYDKSTKHCAIIDAVMDFDYASASYDFSQADEIIAYIEQNQLQTQWILETHIHADHLSASHYLQEKLGGTTAVGEHIHQVQKVFGNLFNTEQFIDKKYQFDQTFSDGEEFMLGSLTVKVLHTAGHTPACVSYVVDGVVFVGDTLFMPDYGTARCDFPGGDANTLYQSVQKLFDLPDETKVLLCHDYIPADTQRDFAFLSTIGEQKQANIHIHQGVEQQQFVAMRQQRDQTLAVPKLMLPSVQVNMLVGQFPIAEDNGTQYLKIPLNAVK
ncbi:MBL fold metallo-hydrolase [Acinetobacter sp. c1-l78]|uniref:MBL fold metallo-hydrolase n=1 Tax=Acinetobacter sp. c1-l78 TaxID=3342803 RepID=UPI0035BB5F8E